MLSQGFRGHTPFPLVRISFDNLPQKYTKKKKDEAEKLIKRFHKETNINQILSSSIPTVYTEGNCIKYLQ